MWHRLEIQTTAGCYTLRQMFTWRHRRSREHGPADSGVEAFRQYCVRSCDRDCAFRLSYCLPLYLAGSRLPPQLWLCTQYNHGRRNSTNGMIVREAITSASRIDTARACTPGASDLSRGNRPAYTTHILTACLVARGQGIKFLLSAAVRW